MPIDTLEFAKQLIACPSITPKEAGALSLLQEALEGMGFTVWRETFSEDSFEDTENLYARLGDQSPNLCFAGHTDVVPPGDAAAWKYPPFEPTIEDGVLYGRGAEDMKGAVASFVAAVSEFLESVGANSPSRSAEARSGGRKRFSGSISLLITADEEGIAINGTRKMLDWMKAKGEVIDGCIVGEPTNPENMGEMIKVGRRGSLLCELTVRGTQGHVAYPEKADNPNTIMVNMLHALKAQAVDAGTDLFPPSNLEITSIDVDNKVDNLIPRKATARFNIRFNNLFDGHSMEQWVRDKLESVRGDYELHARISGESFLTDNKQLAELLIAANEAVLGKTPILSTTGGTSDARFIKDVCPVIEYGTTGPTAHKMDECVKVEDLYALKDIYFHVLRGYFS